MPTSAVPRFRYSYPLRRRAVLTLSLMAAAAGCGPSNDEDSPSSPMTIGADAIAVSSTPLCALAGPANDQPGVYGTDLGFSVPTGERGQSPLMMLFGDTWGEAGDACQYTPDRNDDLLAMLPSAVPDAMRSRRRGAAATSCAMLDYGFTDPENVTTWTRARLFPDPQALAAEQSLPLGFLRTPIGAFRDATKIYGVFHRSEPGTCTVQADCPKGMECSSELADVQLGYCDPVPGVPEGGAPTICRDDADCGGTVCSPASTGMCLTRSPFKVATDSGVVVPDWYLDDPRDGLTQALYIAEKTPDGSGDFVSVQRFVTHRFLNLSLRTVANFDPQHPENNDYRHGYHTLLGFGRPAYVTTGGEQSLPFLFYVTLPQDDAALNFVPMFFTGFDGADNPQWSPHEEEALPIYGGKARVMADDGGQQLQFLDPEFDYVNQMSVSYAEPLGRWVMLYGGDLPKFMVADENGERPAQTVPQPVPGAIHMRSAVHPFGAPEAAAQPDGWTKPRAVLTRGDAAPYMVCSDEPDVADAMPGCLSTGDPHGPLDLLDTLSRYAGELSPDAFAEATGQCLEGQLVDAAQDQFSGNSVGRLYGVNIIEDWTAPLEVAGQDKQGVELYWNVSTWNPYQVVLVRTELYPDAL